ncbi:MAG: hypothetical protein LLG44_13665 [Chloroflexi bacterium]|nr:hypothetical protein [Chloroflexota bacterium]
MMQDTAKITLVQLPSGRDDTTLRGQMARFFDEAAAPSEGIMGCDCVGRAAYKRHWYAPICRNERKSSVLMFAPCVSARGGTLRVPISAQAGNQY